MLVCLLGCVMNVTAVITQVRQSAGLLLKNNLKQQYASLSEDFRNYIKVCVVWR